MKRKVKAFLMLSALLSFASSAVAGGENEKKDRRHGRDHERPPERTTIDNRDTTLIGVANKNNVTNSVGITTDINTTDLNIFAPVDNSQTEITAIGGTGIGIGGQGGTGGEVVFEDGAIRQEQGQAQDQLQQQSQQQTAQANNLGNSQNTSIVFEATRPLAGVLHVGVPESPAVIQYEISRGSEERNLDAHAAYQDTCRPRHTRGNPIVTEELKEGKVVWEFQNHQTFTGAREMGLSTPVSMVLPEDDPETDQDESVLRVDCLGTILAKTVDRKKSPGIGIIEEDVYTFAGNTFGQCTTTLYLFSPVGATGANRGLQARSFAGNALGSLTNIVGGDGTGGTGGGWNGGRSNSFGAVQVGTTYWVLCENPNGPVEIVGEDPQPEPEPIPGPTPVVEPPKDAATTPRSPPPRERNFQPNYQRPAL